eukprot:TRINITY_DN15695_c0_g1_i1.p2 TRINITY_DN15695_c0_g1~~TRINITY_DN15695_c0_g1_i1.p2  ORF type:complete len:191 (+),score=117.85 TRINITY_DN15695_c0_g1_i1:59-574(+)
MAITDLQLREVFDLFDSDGSGTIDSDEIGAVLTAFGFSKLDDDEVKALVAKYDVDFSGTLEYDEFEDLVKDRLQHTSGQAESVHAFKLFAEAKDDAAGQDPCISVQDLARVAHAIGEKVEFEKFQDILNIAPGKPYGVDEKGNSLGMTYPQWSLIMAKASKTKLQRAMEEN